jgi:hypothetical protein
MQPQPPLLQLQQPQEQQQARTRQQRRNAQQAPKAAPSTHHTGWAHLAAVQAAAESRQHRSWRARQKAALSAYIQTPLQRLAQLSAPRAAAAAAAAAGSAADAGPQQDTAAASGTQADELLPGSQPDMLQLCVQHLLGLLVGLNLLLHWQLVLDAAAAAGTWLQHDVLQPHIDWLAQAHPGELLAGLHAMHSVVSTHLLNSPLWVLALAPAASKLTALSSVLPLPVSVWFCAAPLAGVPLLSTHSSSQILHQNAALLLLLQVASSCTWSSAFCWAQLQLPAYKQ